MYIALFHSQPVHSQFSLFHTQLEARYGAEAHRHLFRCLFSHVDFSGDGKSSGKDFHQVSFSAVYGATGRNRWVPHRSPNLRSCSSTFSSWNFFCEPCSSPNVRCVVVRPQTNEMVRVVLLCQNKTTGHYRKYNIPVLLSHTGRHQKSQAGVADCFESFGSPRHSVHNACSQCSL